MVNKKDLRIKNKKIRHELFLKGLIADISKSIVSKIEASNSFKAARHVMLFYPKEEEVNLLALLRYSDKTFYLPRIKGDGLEVCKFKPEDELNCGSCGYDTCREKAIAIYQGKAEISMCMPFLMGKSESFSDNIINNTPNGIIVVNDRLEVQLINRSARKIMNINRMSDVLGEPVVRIMDPGNFVKVLNSGQRMLNKRVYLAEYDKYVEQTIIPDKDYNIIICMLRDVTAEETEKKHRERISAETVDVADKVVERQMRIVQEIASLLGETAAETKIALTKLKETIANE